MVMLTDWLADLMLLADARFIWGFKLQAHMCLQIGDACIDQQYYDIFEQII